MLTLMKIYTGMEQAESLIVKQTSTKVVAKKNMRYVK
jgi:hypothetical protein